MGDDVKKLYDEALTHSGIIDPLAELDIDIQSFDIPRAVTVYPDRAGVRWWTKAWFNNREEGEASVEIEREQAIRFIRQHREGCMAGRVLSQTDGNLPQRHRADKRAIINE